MKFEQFETAISYLGDRFSHAEAQYDPVMLEAISLLREFRNSIDWKVLNNEQPGEEYLDPKEKARGFQNSILMVVVINTNPEREWCIARWNYELKCFFAEYDDQVIGPETLMYHTKLWMPLPVVTVELWRSSFPAIQSSKTFENDIKKETEQ